LQTTAFGRWVLIPYRFKVAASYHVGPLLRIFPWLFRSREPTDFNYENTDLSLEYLAEFLHVVTGVPADECGKYIEELAGDDRLAQHIREMTSKSKERHISDADPPPGRRIAYYALVRATKPKVIVEAGVNKGFGTSVLAAALARNSEEGHTGRVYGVEIAPGKGYLFGPPYDQFGEIIFSDILAFLRTAPIEIDMLIHETVNVPALERDTYEIATPRLAPTALICGPWSTPELLEFAKRTGRNCLVFVTQPKDHWYPGTRLTIAFKSEAHSREQDTSTAKP